MLASIMTFDAPMANHTTFGIGGPAGCLVYPDNREELSELLQYANKENIPAFFTGSGSNILVWDQGFDGFVISLRKTFKRLTIFGILIANVIKTEGIWWANIVIRKIDLRIIGVNTTKPLREAGDIIFS